MISVLINVMGGIFSPYSHVSNHHDIHLKYLTTLFVNYTSIKRGGGMHERRKHPSESSNKTGEWKYIYIYVYTHTHTYRWIWRSLTISAWAPRGPKPIGLERLICSTPHLGRKVNCCWHTSKSGAPPTFYADQLISVLFWCKKILFKNSAFMIVTKITVIFNINLFILIGG